VALAIALVSLFCSGRSAAHNLAIDQLTLFPDPATGRLRGQVLFDPKLTRANNDEGLASIAPRVARFLERNLEVEANGKRVELSFKVRELWTGDGAIGGDSVMFDGTMPPQTKELRVFAGKPFRGLAVSVEGAGSAPKSTLLLGGEWTPSYRFATPENRGWAEGDPELLAAKLPRHSDDGAQAAPSGASPGAPSTSPTSAGSPNAVAGDFAETSAWQTAGRYVRLGVVHIVPWGLDHVLFVAGLVLGSSRRFRALLLQLGAFTLAHTLTLGLGALGLVVLPGRVIEPLIAFSIAFVAVENLIRKGEPRYRAAWAFAFGLLHGQGFAGVLAETGLPRESFLTALFSFNVGVELGQLIVVLALLLVLHGLRDADKFYRFAVRPGSVAIALAGLYWGVERLAA